MASQTEPAGRGRPLRSLRIQRRSAPGRATANARLRGLESYLRKHVFVPGYRPEEALRLVTADGLRLGGARLEGPVDAFATVVLVHGLVHSSRTPRIHAFAHRLAREVHVLVPELRGHGASEGVSTLGRDEPLDVAAAVAAARPDVPVVTVGISLGGAAVLLHAGTYGAVAGVVAVSSPGWWGAWDTDATQRVQRFATSRTGRAVLARVLRTRIAAACDGVPDSRDVVGAIAPAFTLIVHDPHDHYFGREHAETLYGWAREPKGLWWEEGAGHGTDLLTPEFAARLLAELRARVSSPRGVVDR
jgi:pimeloyl-ACP methyl ester carboxylesterase